MKERLIILGCGGHAKSMADSIEAAGSYEIAGFVDRIYDASFRYKGYGMLGNDEKLEEIYRSGIHYACIGVGYLGKGHVREKLYKNLKKIGFILPPILDATATIAEDAQIGEGTFVGKQAVVNAGAVIGRMAIINTAAVVEHDCHVGDFTHIAVAGVLCGAVHIGTNVFVGANVTVIQEIHIGNEALVGAGETVYKDVGEKMKVVNRKYEKIQGDLSKISDM